MKRYCDHVCQHECYRNECEVISSDDIKTVLKRSDAGGEIHINSKDMHDFQTLGKKADDARKNFKENLMELEEKIKPYIQFETIQGWTLF